MEWVLLMQTIFVGIIGTWITGLISKGNLRVKLKIEVGRGKGQRCCERDGKRCKVIKPHSKVARLDCTTIKEPKIPAVGKVAEKEDLIGPVANLECHSDNSVISLVEDFYGDGQGPSVDRFLDLIDLVATIGKWSEWMKIAVVRIKVKDAAEMFLKAKFDFDTLSSNKPITIKYEDLKTALKERFTVRFTDFYNFSNLINAKQKKNESVAQFADRVRQLGNLTLKKSQDPTKRKVLVELAEEHKVSSFLNGLTGKPGELTRQNPSESLDECEKFAKLVETEERDRNVMKERKSVWCYWCNKVSHGRVQCREFINSQNVNRGTCRRKGKLSPKTNKEWSLDSIGTWANYSMKGEIGRRLPDKDFKLAVESGGIQGVKTESKPKVKGQFALGNDRGWKNPVKREP